MSIYDYAIKMETDGRNFFLAQAEKATQPQLKRIWLKLADDELKHLNAFKALKAGDNAEYAEPDGPTVLGEVKNVFEELKAEDKDFEFTPDVEKAWLEARDVEDKAEAFYRQKAEETDDEQEKKILLRIADEEHNHYVAMDNVVRFLQAPRHWLEDAEWGSLPD